MARHELPQEMVARIQAQLPEGYDASELRLLTVTAKLQPQSDIDEDARLALAEMHEAGPQMMTDGRPTIMKVVAWMCHEGVNRNRDAFVAEELKALQPALFKAPNFGVMDWNHSAVMPWSDEPKSIGVWYRSEYAFDEDANEGKGAWGILATGMMFAWLYPEHATKMLGEQARDGHVNFSMACIPGGVEFKEDEQGMYALLHNPVFFTVSALDVPPADPDAVGNVEEGVGPDKANTATAKPEAAMAVAAQEEQMTEQEIKELQDRLAALEAQVADLGPKAEKVAELETRAEEAEGKLAEAQAALVAAGEEKTALAEKINTLTADVERLTAEIDAAQAADAARAKTQRLADRIAALPETLIRALEGRMKPEALEKLQARWAEMTDEEWELHVEMLGVVPAERGRMAHASAAEGMTRLALGGGIGDDEFAERLARIK